MDAVAVEHPDSPVVDTLSGIESKKHRMQTGQDSDDFSSRYELLEQVGSGASGTVWKCRLAPGNGPPKRAGGPVAGEDPVPGRIYAAKIIDLRPFKLRERFSMQRLMREVDIMRRLRHPNIIHLVEALDTPEQLVLILEYAPGVELFDAILSKASFSESEARPVFVQVARALQYMHSKSIVHRDVKPENVMIIDRTAPDGLYPEAKLLDFGLSKAIDADTGGSVARTFVGTPSYLAPEVEERKGGKGKPYGTPVDCWSLGAMLYVMLVARFPEFQVQGARKHVRMHGAAWDKVSAEAKELIRNLMAFDAGARLTVDKALRHPWLGDLAARDAPPSPLQQATAPPRNQFQGMPPLSESYEFVVSPVPAGGAKAEAAAAVGGSDSLGSQPYQQSSGGGSSSSSSNGGDGAWGGRLPIVTEQETPPAKTARKSFEFTPTGPSIRELGPDESPLGSLDYGMGDTAADGGGGVQSRNNKDVKEASNASPREHNSNGIGGGGNMNRSNSMQVDEPSKGGETAMISVHNHQGIGLTRPPPDGHVPLLQLQARITAVMETAVGTYSDCPQGAASLRRSAALCRESLRESVTLLKKIERTAAQVITLFPDLTLAVEEGEPDLARDFFATVKSWVREMYTDVNVVQAHNKANAVEVGDAMKTHAEMGMEGLRLREEELQRQQQQGGTAYMAKGERHSAHGSANTGAAQHQNQHHGDKQIDLDPETFEVVRQIQELRNHLSRTGSSQGSAAPGAATTATATAANGATASATANDGATAEASAEATAGDNSAPSATAADGSTATATAAGGNTASASDGASMAAAAAAGKSPKEIMSDEKLINLFLLMAGRGPNWPHDGPGRSTGGTGESSSGGGSGGSDGSEASGGGSGAQGVDVDGVAGLTAKMSIDDGADAPSGQEAEMPPPPPRQWVGAGAGAGEQGGGEHGAWGGGMQLARVHDDTCYSEVKQALQMLQEVDSVLEQLALFWANSEVIFDVLLRKGDLVEKFVAFANKPRLLQRFRERLADYKRFWEGVQSVCNKYVCGHHKCGGLQGASTPKGAARPRSDSMGADAGATAYDGSYNASSNRTDSNASSVGAQSEAEPSKQGLGDGGGWGNVDMGFAR
ncbi:calcium/ calmodulin-dependent protein kinase 1 [Ectocarpus siliculosus]|uniref:Calcium/ calmodulin-dependent protein kinase 1 n=1 Tax=Ectocarpus siliculosus TaxID=2880 RepID=D7G8N3_ECTSI|nr:calcium/ calmodulin-dependent protein kinase 1 [Ectocarpus siliculosus]|eukprot:CBJ28057.1 calcium/ calmodulin-dependent protein kinase 1 [Ectocarpus siliculosus]